MPRNNRIRIILWVIALGVVGSLTAIIGNITSSALLQVLPIESWLVWLTLGLLALVILVPLGLFIERRLGEPAGEPDQRPGSSELEHKRLYEYERQRKDQEQRISQFRISAQELSSSRAKNRRPLTEPLTWEQLAKNARNGNERRISRALSTFNPTVYLPRDDTTAAFEDFLASDRSCFTLVGKSGMGKSHFLAWLTWEWSGQHPDVCLLLYDGERLNPGISLTDLVAQEVETWLTPEHNLDIWGEIGRIEGIGNRHVVVGIDALDENKGEPVALLQRIDELLRCSDYPWLKIVITCRSESWGIISHRVDLQEKRYYRPVGKDQAGNVSWSVYSHEIRPFGADEFQRAYQEYRRRKPVLPALDDLQPEVRYALREPLLLRLVWEMERIPEPFSVREIIPHYVHYLYVSKRLDQEDICHLTDKLLPSMIQPQAYLNKLRVPAVELSQFDTRLADAGILTIHRQERFCDIDFKHERFWDHYAGEYLFNQSPTPAVLANICLLAIQAIDVHPYMWGVMVNALLRVMDEYSSDSRLATGVFTQLADYGRPDCRHLLVTALDEYGCESPAHRDQVGQLLHSLYPTTARRRLKPLSEERAITAVQVAERLEFPDILEHAAQARSSLVRDRATVGIYHLYCQDNQAGFEILRRMVAQTGWRSLFEKSLLRKGLFDSSIRLSLLIFLRHSEETDVMPLMRDAWQPVIRRFLFYADDSHRWEAIARPIRRILLTFAIRLAHRFEKEVPARYSILNFRELRQYYKLPGATKDKAHALIPFLDPNYEDMASLTDKLRALFDDTELNNTLLMLLIDYVLVAQGQQRFEPVLAVTRELANAELERPVPHRIMWSKSWAYGALALLQPRTDPQFFGEYTDLVRRSVQVGAWRGTIRDYPYVGYADYVYVAAKHGYACAELLQELLEWGIQKRDPQLLLDILEEMGYVAHSPYSLAVLDMLDPLLTTYQPANKPQTGRRNKPQAQEKAVTDKLFEVVAAVRSRHLYETDALLERQMQAADEENVKHLKRLHDTVRVFKTDERIVGDLLKGGLGPWGQFILRKGFSREYNPVMIWAFGRAVQASNFDQFIIEVAHKAINILSGKEVF